MDFIYTLEKGLSSVLGRKVEFEKIYEPLKPGDVMVTYASIDMLYQEVGFKPETSIEEGMQRFARWYINYHKSK